jgi:hypothetical protein
MTLEIVAPFALAFDGDATVFPFMMAGELGPEVVRHDAPYRHTRCAWGVCNGWCT